MIKNYNSKTGKSIPILYFDGGSRGNPGESAGAAVIVMPDGEKFTASQYMKVATNNEAEYTGLIVGLQQAKNLGLEALMVKGDSQLVINQINRKWKVNSPHLKQYYQEAQHLIKSFEEVTLNWIPRHENHLADAAVNRCIDGGEKIQTGVRNEFRTPLKSESQKPLKQDSKKVEATFPYAKGDVILIGEANNSLQHQGVIVSEPKCSEEGSWMITIRIDQICPQINADE